MPITSELTTAHRLWRRLPSGARRAAFQTATTLLAPHPDRRPPGSSSGVTVAGEIGRASGLGEGARIMADATETLGIRVARREAGLVLPGETHELGTSTGTTDMPGSLLVLHVNPPVLPAACLRLGRAALRHRRVVGFWAWELPVVPPSWRAPSRFVHEAWVPSHFAAGAIEPLLPGRVRVVPHALAACMPRPSALTRADFGLPADAVIVLVSFNLASSFERKNPIGAITAFKAAFGDRADRHLLVKVGKSDHFPADMRRLRDAVSTSRNITIETRMFSTSDTHALTSAADIVLSLHRSEGFGLVPAEAMMLGRPVIATDWSATAEFIDETCGLPIPVRLIPARDPRAVHEAPGAVWAEPDHDAAIEALRTLAADEHRRATLGAAGRVRAHACFGTAPLLAALVHAGVAIP